MQKHSLTSHMHHSMHQTWMYRQVPKPTEKNYLCNSPVEFLQSVDKVNKIRIQTNSMSTEWILSHNCNADILHTLNKLIKTLPFVQAPGPDWQKPLSWELQINPTPTVADEPLWSRSISVYQHSWWLSKHICKSLSPLSLYMQVFSEYYFFLINHIQCILSM